MKIKIKPLKTALCVWRTFCIDFFLPLPHITMYNTLFQLNLLDSESFKEEMPLRMSRLKDLHVSSYLSEKAPFPGDSLKCIFSGEYLAKLLCCIKEVSFFFILKYSMHFLIHFVKKNMHWLAQRHEKMK